MLVTALLAASALAAGPAPELAASAAELGDVAWTRSVEAAQQRSARSGKPVLVLFDEVPGCSTVNAFGAGPLSHPLLVEAMETLFEPVLVYNNRGEDDAICEAWGEPRWNNPVLRSVDATGTPLAPRFAGPYTEAATARFLTTALGEDCPPWLTDFAAEAAAPRATPATEGAALQDTRWADVWMTPGQAARANALVAAGRDPSPLFSPRQQAAAGG